MGPFLQFVVKIITVDLEYILIRCYNFSPYEKFVAKITDLFELSSHINFTTYFSHFLPSILIRSSYLLFTIHLFIFNQVRKLVLVWKIFRFPISPGNIYFNTLLKDLWTIYLLKLDDKNSFHFVSWFERKKTSVLNYTFYLLFPFFPYTLTLVYCSILYVLIL